MKPLLMKLGAGAVLVLAGAVGAQMHADHPMHEGTEAAATETRPATTQQRHAMMLEHMKKMQAQMREMDVALDRKITDMQQARGDNKIVAMQAVIETMAAQRKLIHEERAAMMKHMMEHMHDDAMMEGHGAE